MATGYRSSVGYNASILYVGGVVQVAVPIADTIAGAWTATPLYSKIDESVASDADYISSPSNPSASSCKLKLSSLIDPATSTGHTVKYRYQKDTAAGQAISLVVKLLQGSTTIAQTTHTNLANGWVTNSFNLTSGEANSITDYTDLYLVFEATGS